MCQLLLSGVPSAWKRPRGRPRSTWLRLVCDDLSLVGLDIESATQAAADRLLWRELVSSCCATLPRSVGVCC